MGVWSPSLSAWQAQPCWHCGLFWVLYQSWCCSSTARAQRSFLPLCAPFVPFQGQELSTGESEWGGSSVWTGVVQDSYRPGQRSGWGTASPAPSPATAAWAPGLCSCPTPSSGDEENSGNKGSCAPKPFQCPGFERSVVTKMLSPVTLRGPWWRKVSVLSCCHLCLPSRHMDTRLLPQASKIQLFFVVSSFLSNENYHVMW